MTLLYDHSIFLEHDTGNHPECAGRIVPIRGNLDALATELNLTRARWDPSTDAQLARVHQNNYIKRIEEFASGGGGRIEADTVVSPRSYEVAQVAAGAVCDAVRRVVAGDDDRAFCLIRPPGHHALNDNPMGFCLFNNVAVGSRLAISELGLNRVLIIDWDVHHGNGTQATFWEDPQVGFFSIHRWPFYPGTGDANETGSGQGLGTTLNVPVEFGTSREAFVDQFNSAVNRIASKMRPQLILISAGFDAHRLDPIGSLGLESEDFTTLTKSVIEVAKEHSDGKIVSVLEGGYNPKALAESVSLHLRELASNE